MEACSPFLIQNTGGDKYTEGNVPYGIRLGDTGCLLLFYFFMKI